MPFNSRCGRGHGSASSPRSWFSNSSFTNRMRIIKQEWLIETGKEVNTVSYHGCSLCRPPEVGIYFNWPLEDGQGWSTPLLEWFWNEAQFQSGLSFTLASIIYRSSNFACNGLTCPVSYARSNCSAMARLNKSKVESKLRASKF